MPRPILASAASSLLMLTPLLLTLPIAIGCAKPPAVPVAGLGTIDPVASNSPGRRVLVVVNANSQESSKIATGYIRARGIPRENLVLTSTTTADELPESEYRSAIEGPVAANLKTNPNPIDYIVTTMGVPLRIGDGGGYSLDAFLGQIGRDLKPLGGDFSNPEINRVMSPYFGKNEPFSHKKFGFYLVTRLTGYNLNDAMMLFERGLKAKPEAGPFLLDSQPQKPKTGGYGLMEKILRLTNDALTAKGVKTVYDRDPETTAGPGPLMGFAGWGSNDDRFAPNMYYKLRFKPGGIAETFVSTSGRTFRPTTGGQSLVADLIKQGATGVKGYVSEPFTFALCHTNVLFDRYTAGHNLADSFYMATPLLKWKDVVVGDPLCSPYAKRPIKSKSPAMPVMAMAKPKPSGKITRR